ncbi:hypothetical protein PQQ96_23730 [Paraburkholderia sediminicola]|uniref:hypothetical protein n=1 Tax=Paraburkholderia sediminicola TaxID=458836 RepID=UPI0038BAFB58
MQISYSEKSEPYAFVMFFVVVDDFGNEVDLTNLHKRSLHPIAEAFDFCTEPEMH